MAFILDERLHEQTTSTANPFTVTGARSGKRPFSDRMSVNDTTWGTIAAVDGSKWVTGLLTYSNTNQITVTTVFASSEAADAMPTFSGVACDVFCDLPGRKAIELLWIGGTQALSQTQKVQGYKNLDQATNPQSGDYTVVAADRHGPIILTGSGSHTLSFTAAATLGDGFSFYVKNASSGNRILDPNGSEQINGSTTLTLSAGDSALVFCDGTAFWAFMSSNTVLNDGVSYQTSQGLSATQKLQARANVGALWAPGGRLTLVSGTPVMSATQTAKTAIFWAPYIGQMFPWFDGTVSKMVDSGGQLTLNLDSASGHTGYHQNGKNFDLFLENSTGTPRLVSGPAWTNDTTRGYSLAYQDGFETNAATMTCKFDATSGTLSAAANGLLWVGMFRASADGQTQWVVGGIASGGTAGSYLLWNAYNRRLVETTIGNNVSSWTYATASWRQAAGSAGMQAAYVSGASEDFFDAMYSAYGISSTATLAIGVGYNSTSALSGYGGYIASGSGGATAQAQAGFNTQSLGYNTLAAIEYATSGTTTYYGTAGLSWIQGNGLTFRGWF